MFWFWIIWQTSVSSFFLSIIWYFLGHCQLLDIFITWACNQTFWRLSPKRPYRFGRLGDAQNSVFHNFPNAYCVPRHAYRPSRWASCLSKATVLPLACPLRFIIFFTYFHFFLQPHLAQCQTLRDSIYRTNKHCITRGSHVRGGGNSGRYTPVFTVRFFFFLRRITRFLEEKPPICDGSTQFLFLPVLPFWQTFPKHEHGQVVMNYGFIIQDIKPWQMDQSI